ncbi:chemotaxis protein CheA [bacterium]|nr:chemotaxis protein CheA [bacterium]
MKQPNEFREFLQDFMIESQELLQSFEENLMTIESIVRHKSFHFSEIQESVQAIFRAVHTIKSLAGMMGFEQIKSYTHEAESLLDKVRDGSVVVNNEVIDGCFQILDTMKVLIHEVLSNGTTIIVVDDEISKLDKFFSRSSEDAQGNKASQPNAPAKPNSSVDGKEDTSKIAHGTTVRVDTKRLDDLINTVGELMISKNRLMNISKSIAELNSQRQRIAAANHESEAERSLHNQLTGIVEQTTRLILNLQDASMKLRMVPVGYTLRKFQRMIRDIANKSQKDVRLNLIGEETEIDRSVIELLEDPLLHIIRNAIDHGIENPDERAAKGKPREGKITLKAYQENNLIVIEAKDDGRGMDVETIYHKAVEKGLIEAGRNLSEREILNLIFMPGFSTAAQVTELSGRGVGMDVVKKNIVKLNGLIDIRTEVDRGTTFILKLPLTLAIMQALLVEVIGQHYALPLTNVIETLRVEPSSIELVNGVETIQLRNSVLPIVRLSEILGLPSEHFTKKIFIVVIGLAENRMGLVVSALTDQQDVVIKPLGEYLEHIKDFSGATIMANGDISLVVDIASIWNHKNKYVVEEE